MNICGCVVHVAPRALAAAEPAIAAEEGVEIHAKAGDGRFVVTVEDTGTRNASEAIMALHQIPGVLSVTLNYHHFEDLSPRAARATTQPEN
jgi:nitrate reductase NapD